MPGEYPLIPEGEYMATFTQVDEDVSKKGDPKWKLRLTINEPEVFRGRLIFDQVTFVPGGMSRVLMLARRICGIQDEQFDFEPTNLLGRDALVTVKHEPDFNDPEKLRAAVTYDGYRALDSDAPATGDLTGGEDLNLDLDSMPF